MNRRKFISSTAALAATGTLGGGRSHAVGSEHVQSVETAITRLEQWDADVGGGSLCDEAARLHTQVEQWLNHGSYSPTIGWTLQSQVGELSAWAGWLAFDSGRSAEAGHYLQDAVLQARLTDDPALEVRALSYMCLLLVRNHRPRMSLQCAEAALRLAKGWATPRLAALLHLRAAHAYAQLGDAAGFAREMAKATGQLDRGTHLDDPLYVGFVTQQEATGIAGVSYLALNRPERAAHSFREITDNPDPARPRNVVFYTVRLAQALAQQGDIIQASDVGLEAIPAVASLQSARTTTRLADLRADVHPHRATVPSAGRFIDAYDETFAT